MIEIIPAIDIMNGQCVRLSQGNFQDKTVYAGSPLEIAKAYEAIGIKRLHLVDLDGAKAGSIKNLATLQAVAAGTSLIIDYGGGIRTDNDVASVLDAGAIMINVSSIAIKQPTVFTGWIQQYGADKILLGADVKNERIAVSGWAEHTDVRLFDFIQQHTDKGISNFFCTDIQQDGMLAGPSLDLFSRIVTAFPGICFIASGGVSKLYDIVALEAAGCKGVIVGKALYEGRITLHELQTYISNGTN